MSISLLEATDQLKVAPTILTTVPTVFCDCDGVLADFYGSCKKILNKTNDSDVENVLNRAGGWDGVREKHPNLFGQLDVLPDAQELVDALVSLRNHQLIRLMVLTALPDSWLESDIKESAIQDKKIWVNKHFPAIAENDVIVCYRRDKAVYGMADKIINHAKPILIDDYNKNVTEWVARTRGYAIQHTDAKSSIAQLKIYLTGLRIGEPTLDMLKHQLSIETIEPPNSSDLIIPLSLDTK